MIILIKKIIFVFYDIIKYKIMIKDVKNGF